VDFDAEGTEFTEFGYRKLEIRKMGMGRSGDWVERGLNMKNGSTIVTDCQYVFELLSLYSNVAAGS
jgi:hypothetical protein